MASKYPQVNEPVFITAVNPIHSQYGGEVWEIRMMGIKTRNNYKTYADPQNNNWTHWEWIVDVAQRKGVVLTGCKLKDPLKGLINADSHARPEYVVSNGELADILEEYWASQDKYNQLFGA